MSLLVLQKLAFWSESSARATRNATFRCLRRSTPDCARCGRSTATGTGSFPTAGAPAPSAPASWSAPSPMPLRRRTCPGDAACAAPQLCDVPPGGPGRHPRRPAASRPPEHRHDGDLHPPDRTNTGVLAQLLDNIGCGAHPPWRLAAFEGSVLRARPQVAGQHVDRLDRPADVSDRRHLRHTTAPE
jgi:hypothetical protein